VFPETFVPWYPYFSFIRPPMLSGREHIHLYDNAVVVPGPVTEAVANGARKHNIVVVLGVNERDHGTLYNTQLVFDADGTLVLKRRKITPTFHERMIWGQGDGAGLKVVDTAVGRIGALACWEHYNPLARYALMAQHEEIHVASFRARWSGRSSPTRSRSRSATTRWKAGCFVVNATGWLTEEQIAKISPDEGPQPRPARRLHDRDHLAGRQSHRAAADRGRGHGDRRSRHGADRQAQADDGFGRPLRAARTAEPRDQRPRRPTVADAVMPGASANAGP
jgi:predicted amidohydrolase